MTLKDRFASLTCRHQWSRVAMIPETDPETGENYYTTRYQCQKCRRVSHQDSRKDKLARKAVAPCP